MSKGTLFDAVAIGDLISKVKGKSSLARLSNSEPIPFNGLKEFTFSMDSEIDVVAENAAKSHGGVDIQPVTIVPIKVEYGARVSDEFVYGSDEVGLNILRAFNDGFARKVAKGFDLMAFHGVNPRTGNASTVIGDNHFDAVVDQTVTFDASKADANVEAAISMVRGSDGDVSGLAMDSAFASALAGLEQNGARVYPQLAWGANPGNLNGLAVDINNTVYNATVKDHAILGDFEAGFKWGYAKEIPVEVIEYGDPDNSGKDLKGHNQVYLRAELYLGWGILLPKSFARIVEA